MPRINGTLNSDLLQGGSGDDIIHDWAGGADTLRGGAGNDVLIVQRDSYGGGPIVMQGEDGDDYLLYSSGRSISATLDGGAGSDRFDIRLPYGDITITTGAGSDVIALQNHNPLFGPNFSGSLTISDFTTGAGGDRVEWGAFFRTWLTGWAGGNPFALGYLQLVQSGSDTVLKFDRDAAGSSYASETLLIFKNVQKSTFTAFNLDGFDPNQTLLPTSVTGAGSNDTLSGTSGADDLHGLNGDDFLRGYSGNDVLEGSAQNDVLNGGEGDDRLDGGAGTDVASYLDARLGVAVDLALQGSAQNTVGAGADTLISIENLHGSAFSDTLRGDAADNTITDTQGGSDTLVGGGGNDVITATRAITYGGDYPNSETTLLDGGDGNDVLTFTRYVPTAPGVTVNGGAGDDVITVNGSNATIDGGSGNDRITLSLHNSTANAGDGDDVITVDTSAGQHTINLGTGSDRIALIGKPPVSDYVSTAPLITVVGFTGGPGGDVIDLTGLLADAGFTNYTPGANPFTTGHLRLVGTPEGSPGGYSYPNAQLMFSPDGGTTPYRAIMSLGVWASDLTAANFGGFRPSPLVLNGTASYDTLNGTEDAETINGLAQTDTLIGRGGDDILDGGADRDILFGDYWKPDARSNGSDTLDGGAGDDLLIGGGGDDILRGGDGDDFIYTGVVTHDGPYTPSSYVSEKLDLTANGGFDVTDGGAGLDTAFLMHSTATASIVFDNSNSALVNSVMVGGVARGSITGVESINFYGGSAADTVTGGVAGDQLMGAGGDDHLNGGLGRDVLKGEVGTDQLNGGDGDDVLSGGDGADQLNGGAGLDVADYADAATGVTIDLAAQGVAIVGGAAAGDVLTAMEGVNGTAFADVLLGGSGTDILSDLRGGTDRLEGRGGDDILVIDHHHPDIAYAVQVDGGDGNDVISVDWVASATISGGAGDDVVAFNAGSGAATISLGAGTDTVVFTGYVQSGLGHVITDFTTGDGGDVLDLGEWLSGVTSSNPLRQGFLGLVQSGADTLLLIDKNGGGDNLVTAVRILNTQASSFTTYNLGGLNPVAMPYIQGTWAIDTLVGGDAGEEIEGFSGTDFIQGGGGDDIIKGGDESWPYDPYGDGVDGGDGNDALYGGDGGDTLAGGAGADMVYGGLGNDILMGHGAGLTARGPFNLNVNGYSTTALLFTLGDVRLDDGVADTLQGDAGNDIIYIGAGDTASGGEGTDRVIVNLSHLTSALNLDLRINADDLLGGLSGSSLSGFESYSVEGTALADTMIAGGGDDALNGGAGNDTLTGGVGTDSLIGGRGADTLNGGDGNDNLSGSRYTNGQLILVDGRYVSSRTLDDGEVDVLNGGAGLDAVNAGYGDLADGGEGTDSLSLTLIRRTSAVNLDLSADFQGVLAGVQGGSLAGFESLSGLGLTSFNDILRLGANIGGSHYGHGGDDQLFGNDLVQFMGGDEGNDRLEAFGGNDSLWGSAGDDVLLGGEGLDALHGDGSNDNGLNADVPVGNDTIDGGGGNDTIWGGGGNDTILGGAGNDTIRSDENSFFAGTLLDGVDVVDGGEGNDNIQAGGGNDRLTGGLGDDTLNGGAGTDTAVFSGARSAYTFTALSGGSVRVTGADGTDTLTDVERLLFSDGLYNTAGQPLPNDVPGTPNADTLAGTAGRDAFEAGDGDDTITGAAGDDVIDGGAGTDTAVFSAGAYSVAVNAGVVTVTGPDGTDALTNVERLRFGTTEVAVAALLASNSIGTAAGETLTGGATADGLFGLGGNDTLNGGDGDDLLAGGAGTDTLTGGNGLDTADYSAAAAAVTARLDTLKATADGDGGTDTFVGIEAITGSAFNDLLVGGASGDTLKGGLGADTLLGQAGNDILWGGTGALNQLQGGAGDDRYILEVADSVVEAAGAGTDTVEARIASYNLAANVENLVYGGTGNFSGTGNVLNNVMTGGAGDDLLRGRGGVDSLVGGNGMDTADYSQAAAGIHARLDNMRAVTDGDGGTDTFTGIEAILGSAFNDTLVGGTLGDRLSGGLGADTLLGFAGNDILAGGQGLANQLQGGLGDDLYVLDAYDSIVEIAGQGHDTIEAHVGAHNMAANVEDMFYVGFNKFYGTGNASNNTITGGIGDDILKGMGGSDRLFGGAGYDEVHVRGAQAQYTVTAEASGWRIVDTVAGRDGSIYVESIEALRFLTGNTKTVLTYAATSPEASAGKGAAPETSPIPAGDDPFVLPALKDLGPEVMPELPTDLLASREAGGFEALLARFAANPLVVDGTHGLQLLMDDGYSHRDGDWLV